MDCRPVSTPMELNLHKLKDDMIEFESNDPTLYGKIISSLMNLVSTHPDICYATNTLSQFMCAPKKIHLMVAKHILRYLRGTIGLGIKYDQVKINLHGFIDFDWASSSTNCKSTSVISCIDRVCQGCVLGKYHKDPFPGGRASHVKAPLELIHCDLMSFSTPSFLGAQYFLTFIDEFSRCT